MTATRPVSVSFALKFTLFFLLVAYPNLGEAGISRKCLYSLGLWVNAASMVNDQGKLLQLQDLQQAKTITIQVADRKGFGLKGAVYVVLDTAGIDGLPETGSLVVKFPHSRKFIEDPLPKAEKENMEEAEGYHVILTHAAAIGARPELANRDLAWEEGKVPIAPIFKTITTERGTLLFKPELTGPKLSELLVGKRSTDLSSEMQQSLHDIYLFVDAVRDTVQKTTDGQLPPEPYVIDYNVTNLIWVSDPEQMQLVGLSRPSFVFVEGTRWAWPDLKLRLDPSKIDQRVPIGVGR
jgi:hypothetical protein